MKRVSITSLVILAALAGCGGSSMPSRTDVEHEVARQAKAAAANGDADVKATTHCVESGTERVYDCTVAYKISSGKYGIGLKPARVEATVSKDGKTIVVDGL